MKVGSTKPCFAQNVKPQTKFSQVNKGKISNPTKNNGVRSSFLTVFRHNVKNEDLTLRLFRNDMGFECTLAVSWNLEINLTDTF